MNSRATRIGVIVALVAMLVTAVRPGPVAGFSGFGAQSADATYGVEMVFDVSLPGGAPDRLELLLRFTGSDEAFVAPVTATGTSARYRWDAAARSVTPNTRIDHQWRAIDGGRMTLSPLRTLLYDDDRPGLNWRTAPFGDATVHWYGNAESSARRFGEISSDAAARAEELLGHPLAAPRPRGGGAPRPPSRRPGRYLRLRVARRLLRCAGTRGSRVDRGGDLPVAAHHLHVGPLGIDLVPRDHDHPRGDARRLPGRDRQPVPRAGEVVQRGTCDLVRAGDRRR